MSPNVPISPNLPITPNLPISPNFLEIYISNYFVRVIFRIDFPKSSSLNLLLIAFGRVFNYTHFGDVLHTNLLWNTFNIWKNCSSYYIIQNAYTFFHFLNGKFYFCSYISKCAYIAEFAEIAENPILENHVIHDARNVTWNKALLLLGRLSIAAFSEKWIKDLS